MAETLHTEKFLRGGDFQLLKATLEMAAQQMSKAQVLELADRLHEELRSRREVADEPPTFHNPADEKAGVVRI